MEVPAGRKRNIKEKTKGKQKKKFYNPEIPKNILLHKNAIVATEHEIKNMAARKLKENFPKVFSTGSMKKVKKVLRYLKGTKSQKVALKNAIMTARKS